MKRLKIIRSKRAEDDLLDLWLRIAERDVDAAERLFDRVAAAERRLIDYPELGKRREELGPRVRVLALGIDLLLYRYSEETVRILRVVDGRRRIGAADIDVDDD